MTTNPLDPAAIAKLLQEEASQPTRTRGPRVDPTADRSINGWFKLLHHLCHADCEHRVNPDNPTVIVKPGSGPDEVIVENVGAACWNPNCVDHVRDKETDRGTNIVAEVKSQFICRYCYLTSYLV